MLHITACGSSPSSWFVENGCGADNVRKSLISFWEGFAVDLSTDLMSRCRQYLAVGRYPDAPNSNATSNRHHTQPSDTSSPQNSDRRPFCTRHLCHHREHCSSDTSWRNDWGKQHNTFIDMACSMEYHRVICRHHGWLRSGSIP